MSGSWSATAVTRPGPAVAALAASVVLGVAAPFEVVLALAAALLVVSALVMGAGPALRAPYLGLCVLVLVAVALPGPERLSSVGGFTVPLAAAVAGVGAVRWLAPGRGIVLEASPAVTAALALAAVATLSFAVGQFPWFPVPGAPLSAQLAGLGIFLLSVAVFLVVGHEVRTTAQLARLVWLFLGAGVVVMLLDVAGTLGIPVPGSGLVGTDTIGSLFWTWLVALLAAQGLSNSDLGRGPRALLLGLAALVIVRGLLLSFSWVSGWLPPLVALGVVLLLRFPRLVVGAGLLAAAPLAWVARDVMASLVEGESYSLMTRADAIEVMRPVLERNPWLGLGPANYYHYTLLFPILGWYVSFSSHNNYVDLVAQIGVVGLGAFLWFSVAVGVLALTLRGRVRSPFQRAYLTAALGGLVGSLVAGLLADWILPFVYNIGLRGFRSSVLFWVFLGGVLAVKRMQDRTMAEGARA